jgi:hypothetical protein
MTIEFTASMVKAFREKTGSGMMESKQIMQNYVFHQNIKEKIDGLSGQPIEEVILEMQDILHLLAESQLKPKYEGMQDKAEQVLFELSQEENSPSL